VKVLGNLIESSKAMGKKKRRTENDDDDDNDTMTFT
jgi:hypothetical protein